MGKKRPRIQSVPMVYPERIVPLERGVFATVTMREDCDQVGFDFSFRSQPWDMILRAFLEREDYREMNKAFEHFHPNCGWGVDPLLTELYLEELNKLIVKHIPQRPETDIAIPHGLAPDESPEERMGL